MSSPLTHYLLVDPEGRIWSGGEVDDENGGLVADEDNENAWISFIVNHLDELTQIPITEAAWEQIFLVSGTPENFDAFNPETYRSITEFAEILA